LKTCRDFFWGMCGRRELIWMVESEGCQVQDVMHAAMADILRDR
jgi:hypothetical protein